MNNQSTGHRQDERSSMCTTFKIPAAAAVLLRVDAEIHTLGRPIAFEAKDVVVKATPTVDQDLKTFFEKNRNIPIDVLRVLSVAFKTEVANKQMVATIGVTLRHATPCVLGSS